MSKHAIGAGKFIANAERTKWHDQALFMVRSKRDKLAREVPEWESLRSMASAIKQHTLSHLPQYLEEFERHARLNGIHVHWAKDADEHNSIVLDIIRQHNGSRLIKSKSMLAEECGMNEYLQEHGIDVVETDLGERIMQFLQSPPSHIVLPAIHVKREEVGKVFEEKLATEPGNSDPTYLTHAARGHLREIFLNSEIAMTGVNFAVASSGAFVVCTNEGNADMGTSFAKVHIAIMGMEKLVPDYDSLGVFIRLLGRSATGQPSTTYTSHYKKPVGGQEMHLIIVDNGRSETLANPDHREILKCMRCGACMNTCPVYRRSGGYSYSYFIPGPLGINLGMLRDPKKNSGDCSACTLCYSCQNVCPAKVNLTDQIYAWRQQLDSWHLADPMKKKVVSAMTFLMSRPGLFTSAVKMAPMLRFVPNAILYSSLNTWGKGRDLPPFPKHSFASLWKNGEVTSSKNEKQ